MIVKKRQEGTTNLVGLMPDIIPEQTNKLKNVSWSSSIFVKQRRSDEDVEHTKTSQHSLPPSSPHRTRTARPVFQSFPPDRHSDDAQQSLLSVERSVTREESGDANEEGVEERAWRDGGSGGEVGVELHEGRKLGERNG